MSWSQMWFLCEVKSRQLARLSTAESSSVDLPTSIDPSARVRLPAPVNQPAPGSNEARRTLLQRLAGPLFSLLTVAALLTACQSPPAASTPPTSAGAVDLGAATSTCVSVQVGAAATRAMAIVPARLLPMTCTSMHDTPRGLHPADPRWARELRCAVAPEAAECATGSNDIANTGGIDIYPLDALPEYGPNAIPNLTGDYFHPSAKGQTAIAALSWRQGR